MGGYVEGWDRRQTFLLPECLDDYVGEDNPIRVIEAFVDELDLRIPDQVGQAFRCHVGR
jgi:transposase